ncbi:hypothetical protein LMH87_006925 [Akanthomyces muscarius]|uniref:F-box domain-containing protein n=1 Tax=Akanthomyces muscarius TaxID=2231603 RepID=A0A9W8QS37_AKAMU|nr:hypothetical protein LMH87_006925 [Akanthomyces muscarius]KAJ4165287.1 hypothetical protein LMH87_006925 [Akanthomyces muscarius]
MTSPGFSEELIAMLSVDPEPRHCLLASATLRPDTPMGRLEKLPKEITLQVLETLDIQSLYRLSQSCFRARRLVQDFQPYREILKHAPTLPFILAKTKLLSRHAALHIFRQVLRSDRCSSCRAFGAYAFLLTCERVCMHCLNLEKQFKFVEMSLAKSIFVLNDEQIAAAPSCYCPVRDLAFVRVKDAEEIATALNEPQSLFVSLGLDRLFISYCSITISSSAAYIPFPTEAGPDGGRHCLGCLTHLGMVFVQALSAHPPNSASDLLNQKELNVDARLYSRTEFLGHVNRCPGVQRLLQERQ